MAEHTIRFHDEHGEVTHQLTFDVWKGNRFKTTQQALAIAQSIYAYLVWRDDESHDAVWLGIGNDGIDQVNEIKAAKSADDWEVGAVTMEYLLNGRRLTACFSMSQPLMKQLVPEENFFLADAEKFFSLTH